MYFINIHIMKLNTYFSKFSKNKNIWNVINYLMILSIRKILQN